MTLEVFSARIGWCARGNLSALDITRKSAGPAGLPFAPSWRILRPALDARREADALMARAKATIALPLDHPEREDEWSIARDAEDIRDAAWDAYVPAYLAEMRVSYRTQRAAWDSLLARPRVVLLCYCTEAQRCHRTLLRSLILPTLGAVDAGEVARVAA